MDAFVVVQTDDLSAADSAALLEQKKAEVKAVVMVLLMADLKVALSVDWMVQMLGHGMAKLSVVQMDHWLDGKMAVAMDE